MAGLRERLLGPEDPLGGDGCACHPDDGLTVSAQVRTCLGMCFRMGGVLYWYANYISTELSLKHQTYNDKSGKIFWVKYDRQGGYCCCSVTRSCLTLCDPRACRPPLSVGFLRQEHSGGLPSPSPGELPGPGIKPVSPALAARLFTTEPPGKPQGRNIINTLNALGNP